MKPTHPLLFLPLGSHQPQLQQRVKPRPIPMTKQMGLMTKKVMCLLKARKQVTMAKPMKCLLSKPMLQAKAQLAAAVLAQTQAQPSL
jgi:hypothetical protein